MTDTRFVGARFQRVFLRTFNAAARVTGVIWIVGGAVSLLAAFAVPSDRALHLCAGSFVVLGGFGLLIAKPVTEEQLDRIRGVRPRKDSTDQRGPDEWQA